jgi:hypothetical protein
MVKCRKTSYGEGCDAHHDHSGKHDAFTAKAIAEVTHHDGADGPGHVAHRKGGERCDQRNGGVTGWKEQHVKNEGRCCTVNEKVVVLECTARSAAVAARRGVITGGDVVVLVMCFSFETGSLARRNR